MIFVSMAKKYLLQRVLWSPHVAYLTLGCGHWRLLEVCSFFTLRSFSVLNLFLSGVDGAYFFLVDMDWVST